MGRTYERIDDAWRAWIAQQPAFFVGTAPLDAEGHVNVSPKGPAGTFRVLDDHTVAYLDVIGSGAETIAHLRENGRIVVMFCAFEGAPRILRLHGRGAVVLPDDARYARLLLQAAFTEPSVAEARRSIVVITVERVSDSCGYGVPLMSYAGERPNLDRFARGALRRQGPDALQTYTRRNNATSIDGLPAVPSEQIHEGPTAGGSARPAG